MIETLTEVWRSAGVWTYTTGVFGGLSLVGVAVLVGLRATGRRIPATWWWIGPALVATIGLVGAATGLGEAGEALEFVTPGNETRMAARGLVLSLDTAGLAAIINTVLCGGISLGLGVAVYRTRGPDGSAGVLRLPVAIAAVAVVIIGVLFFASDGPLPANGWSLVVGAALAVGTVGCVFANFGGCSEDRVVDRYMTGFGLVAATMSAVFVAIWTSFRTAIEVLERVVPSRRKEIVEDGGRLAEQATQIGVVATLAALLVAALLVGESRETAVSRSVLVRVGRSLLPVIPVVGAAVFVVVELQSAPFVSSLYEVVSGSR